MLGLFATLLVAGAVQAQTNYFSKGSATSFSDPASWGTNADGSGTAPASVSSADNFTISNSTAMVLDASASVRQLTISSGSLTVSSNTLTVSHATGNNSTLAISGGTLNLSSGSILVNGNFAMSSGALNQSGGSIVLDGNDNNTAASSVPVSTHLFAISGGTPNCTAGSITIVDPPINTTAQGSARAVSIGLAASNNYFSGTHTFILGDGVSTTPGNTDGFVVENFASSRAPIQNLTVNGGSATGRWGAPSYGSSSSWGTYIKGTLTINSGSEFRIVQLASASSGNELMIGSIVNNGTFTTGRSATSPTVSIGGLTSLSGYTPSGASSISGTGVYRNLTTGATAAFNNLTFNNPNGINFAAGSLALGALTGHVSGTLTFTSGMVNLGGQTFVLGTSPSSVGTLSYAAGGFNNGTFKRFLTTTTLGASYSTSTPTFPFVNSLGQARHVYLFRSATLGAAGSMSASFTEVAGLSPASITDGAYVIDNRSNTSWSFGSGDGLSAGSATFTIGLAGEGLMPLAAVPGSAPRIVQSASALGNHQAATGTIPAPIAARTGFALASLTGNAHYYGINANDIAIYTVQSGNWEDGSTWNTGTVPTSTNAVQIMAGHTVTVNGTAAAVASMLINNTAIVNVTGSSLTLSAPAASGAVVTTLAGGQLNINGGSVNIGTLAAATRYAGYQNNGTLTIASGNLNIYGYLINASGATFTQSGGSISVDQNAGGVVANSYTAGAGLQFLNNATNITISGGSITIVDPNANTSATAAFLYSGTGTVYAANSHTFKVGDGASTDAGGNVAGFRITPGTAFVFGNLVIDALAGGTNRSVSTTTTTYVRNDLTVTSGELSASSTLGVGGNIVNNGMLTVTGTLSFVSHSGGSPVAGTNAQSIGGTGTFRNNATTTTASVASLTFNNSNAGGVTLNVPLSVSGTLTLTSGIVNTTSSNLLTLGTATAGGTLSGTPSATAMVKGPFARTIAASQTNTSTSYVFPVGKSGYNNLDIVGPQTSASGAVTIQAEVFDGNAGGTAGNTFTSLSTSRYWQVQVLNGASNLTGTFVRLNDTRGANTGIASSSTQSGVYNLAGGGQTVQTANSITTVAPAIPGSSLAGFYLMGITAPPVVSVPVAVMGGGDRCAGSVPRNVSVTVTPAAGAITSVVITYAVNGGTAQTVAMTNAGGNNWTGTIPSVTPSNGIVSWSVTATDANGLVVTQTGSTYFDNPLLGYAVSVAANPSTICLGASSTLTASTSFSSGRPAVFGAGATTSSSGAATPFYHFYGGTKSQYIILASELQAKGITATNLASLAFDITSVGTATMKDFSISLGNTSATAAVSNAAITSGLTMVYSNAAQALTTGVNTYNFSTPFHWDGTSNIVVSVVFNNNNTGGSSTTVKSDVMSFTASMDIMGDNITNTATLIGATTDAQTGGSATTNGTSSNRPRMTFTYAAPLGSVLFAASGFADYSNGNTLTVTPTATTAYQVMGFELADMGGCSTALSAASATVTVNPLPDAPSASGSSQCGAAVPTASVTSNNSGFATHTFKWYDAASGGNLLQNSTSATYSTAIGSTTTFYVAEVNPTTGCESDRTPVTVTVTSADLINASRDVTDVCPGTTVTLSAAQAGSNQNYTYTWTASPANGSGITGSVTGQSVQIHPTLSGVYTYTVTGIDGTCSALSTVSVTIAASPAAPQITASASTVCAGSAVTLTPNVADFRETMENFPLTGYTVAGGTATQNTTYHAQGASSVLFTGGSNANASLSGTSNMDLTFFNAAQLTFQHIAAMEGPTTTYDKGFVEYSSDGGSTWVPFPASSYAGSGTLVGTDVSFSTKSYADWISVFTSADSLPNNGLWKTETINIPAAALTSQFRIRFRYTSDGSVNYYGWLIDNVRIVAGPAVASYNWSTGATSTVATPSITVNPLTTTTYTVSGTNVNGCTGPNGSITITVNPLPSAPTATGSTQCGTQVPTAAVTSTSGLATPSFKWYDAATGGTLLQSSTSATFTSTVAATTTFYVAELNSSTGCEGERTPVTITVVQPNAVTASGNASICLGLGANLSVSQTGTENTYTYSWSASPATGSGITGSVPGATPSVVPTAAGTYTYTVTATDGGCITTSSFQVTVKAPAPVPSVTASVTTSCSGAPVVLTPQQAGFADAFEASSFNGGELTHFTVAGSGAAATRSTLYFAEGTSSVRFAVTANDASATMASSSNIDMSGMSSAQLVFSHQALMEGPGTSYDFGFVDYSSDGGATWTPFPTTSYSGSATLMNGVVSFSTKSYADWISAFSSSSALPSNTLWKTETLNIPSSALSSQFRIRFRYTTDGSTTYYGWMIDNVRIGGGPTVTNYLWSTGESTTAASSALTVNPTSTTTYYVQAGDASGCYSGLSAGVTVNVNPLPSAPTASGSTQCGTQVPTASVASNNSGFATHTFKWYDAASGGNLLQNSPSATYASTVASTTTLYVAEVNTTTGCESDRTPVTITVNQPDAVTASANGPICLGASINLSAIHSGSVNNYTYAWTAAPATSSGITGPQTGITATVTPTATGTFAYTITATDAGAGCATTSTVNVTVNANPTVTSVTSNTNSVCPNGSLTLTATSVAVAAGTVTVGEGTLTSASSQSPFYHLWGGQKHQSLFTAAELQAAGLRAGNITGLQLDMVAGGTTYNGFALSIGSTSQTALTTTMVTGLSTVYSAASYTTTANSLNTINFSTPFNWDGTSNLVVQMCWSNNNGGGTSSTVRYDNTSFVSVAYIRLDNQTPAAICSNNTGSGTFSARPKMNFFGQASGDITGNYNWIWTPGNLSGAVVNAIAPSTAGTVTYTATATNATTGCTASGTVNVAVGAPILIATSSTPAAICAGASASITANVTGGGAPYTYSWKDAGNTVLGTTQTLSVAPTATAVYTVTVTDFCGTQASQTVTVTVNALPTASISPAGPTSVCATSQTLTASTPAASPTYQWQLNGTNVASNGTSVSYNAVASGNYTVKVTDGTTGCTGTSAAATVNLLAFPSSIAVTPSSATTICLGSSQTLTATATLQNNTTPNVAVLSENFNGSGPYNFSVVNGTMTNNISAWKVRTAPYSYDTDLTNVSIDGTNFILANSDEAGSGSTTQTRLVSNSFSTVGYTAVEVSFKHFARSGGTMVVEYSTDGSTWTALTNGTFSSGTTGGGTNPPTITSSALSLPAAALNKPGVRVRFRYDAGWNWYWGVDDIQIKGASMGYYSWSAAATAGVPTAAQSAAASNNSISVTPTAAGSYTYTVTASVPGNACTNTSTITLNVLTPSAAPATLNASVSSATCAGSNVILTQTGGSLGDGAHWQWYKDAAFTQTVGGPLTSANAQITVNPAATTTYYLRSEGGSAPCAANVSGAASVTITVRTPLSAQIAAANPVQCETGVAATLNISNGPANGTVTVTTNGANPQTVTLDGSGSATFTTAPLMANSTFAITSVSDGTCTTTINTSATVFVGSLIANPINNQSVCATSTVGPIAFTGNFPAGTQYAWTATNGTAIGMAANSGTGTGLPAFTAVNAGSSNVYTDISVTPIIEAQGCKVRPMVFRIFVKPAPSVNAIASQTVCAGTPTTAVAFTSPVANATFLWTNSNTAIGLAAAGGGTGIAPFTAQNNTASNSISGTLTVTPVAEGCSGASTTFTITVNRSVAAIAYSGSPYCQGGTVNPVISGTRGGTFASTAGLTINATTGQINLGQSQPGTYTITYTAPAAAGACGGAASTQISIKPQATVNTIGNQVYCNGMVTAPVAFSGTAQNFSWTNDNPGIGLAASGTGTSLPSFTTVNGGPGTQYAYVKVTPLGDAATCNGKLVAFRIAVNFCPPVTQAGGTNGGDDNARMAAQVVVGPNPTTNRITVNYSGTENGPFTVQLLSQQGQVITRPATFSGTTFTIDLTGITPGSYVLRLVNTRTGASVQKQIIKL
ncbi:T9SS type A sorting domain-containing protein [Flaviaesturariibacter aridisoli]|uniref:Ig-like domain-containing protein n=1 Tax=Flaviaesturariibacter aridisoli TaxID=2545761 RepID=UPI0014050D58|nr:T9SS type A sorting domain-containing protein [Flaviaesturariibacter aridisoli]